MTDTTAVYVASTVSLPDVLRAARRIAGTGVEFTLSAAGEYRTVTMPTDAAIGLLSDYPGLVLVPPPPVPEPEPEPEPEPVPVPVARLTPKRNPEPEPVPAVEAVSVRMRVAEPGFEVGVPGKEATDSGEEKPRRKPVKKKSTKPPKQRSRDKGESDG